MLKLIRVSKTVDIEIRIAFHILSIFPLNSNIHIIITRKQNVFFREYITKINMNDKWCDWSKATCLKFRRDFIQISLITFPLHILSAVLDNGVARVTLHILAQLL